MVSRNYSTAPRSSVAAKQELWALPTSQMILVVGLGWIGLDCESSHTANNGRRHLSLSLLMCHR